MSKKKPILDEASKAALLKLDKALWPATKNAPVIPIAPADLPSVQKAIELAAGNIELNAFLRKDKINELGLSAGIKENLEYFSYKTRNIDIEEAGKILDKMAKTQAALKEGRAGAEVDRVSLKEFAIISELAKTTKFLDKLEVQGLVKGSEKLEKFHKVAHQAKTLIAQLDKEVRIGLAAAGPGIIAFKNPVKEGILKRKVESSFIKLVSFLKKIITKHSHTATIYVNEREGAQPQVVKSEIFHGRKLKHRTIDVVGNLTADTYKINVSALIPKEKHQLMIAAYGTDWEIQIAAKYKLIENNIHGDEAQKRFGNLNASGEMAGVAMGVRVLIPFGHKQIKSNDFEEIHRRVMGNHYAKQKNPTMLCSEFSAVTVIGALVELDKQIKKDVLDKNPQASLGKDIVKIPFGKHENLHRLHPSRLLKVLQEHRCVERVQLKTDQYFKEEAMAAGKKAQKHVAKAPRSAAPPPAKQQAKAQGKGTGRAI